MELSSSSTPDLSSLSAKKLGLETVDPIKPEESAESQFHQYLMEMGTYFKESGEYPMAGTSRFAGLAKTVAVGDTKSFKVLSSLSSLSQTKTVQATLRVKTSDLLIYVDNEAASEIQDVDVENLATDFGDIALPLERELFGRESDVNGDGTMTILMTPVLNRMASSGGLVTGFFYPLDLFVQENSNQMEIFYTLVSDPQGKFGPSLSVDFTINNILPGVLAHEYQHMTSYQQHVFVNGGSTEVSWANELLSHFSEDITGFGKENPSRVRLGLASPQTSPLTPATSPGLAERGMGYLFIRYLYEQSPDGDAFISRLYQTSDTGRSNIEQAFAGTSSDFDDFDDFVKNWSMAVALSDTNATTNPRYNYEPRTIHPETGNYMGICLRCDTQDGRGTVLSGPAVVTPSSYPLSTSVESSAIQYFLIKNPSGPLTLNLSGNNVVGAIAELK